MTAACHGCGKPYLLDPTYSSPFCIDCDAEGWGEDDGMPSARMLAATLLGSILGVLLAVLLAWWL